MCDENSLQGKKKKIKNHTSRWPTLMISPKYLMAGRNRSCISQQKNTVLEGVRLPKVVIWKTK